MEKSPSHKIPEQLRTPKVPQVDNQILSRFKVGICCNNFTNLLTRLRGTQQNSFCLNLYVRRNRQEHKEGKELFSTFYFLETVSLFKSARYWVTLKFKVAVLSLIANSVKRMMTA